MLDTILKISPKNKVS